VTTPQDPSTARPEPLSVREGRRPAAAAPHEGVPSHLEPELRPWLHRFLTPELQRRVAMQLGITLTPHGFSPRIGGPPTSLAEHPEVDLLDAVDVALHLDPELPSQLETIKWERDHSSVLYGADKGHVLAVGDLSRLLDDANSVYQIRLSGDGRVKLLRRVTPTAEAAVDEAVVTADETAGDLLRSAWAAAHAREPDPNTAYLNAVRAVETQIATDGLIAPKNSAPTLGTMVRDLRNGAHNFEIVLLDSDGNGSVCPLVEMLERLWRGNVCRHGGLVYRDQTLDEARAALQLAVTCMQWLSTGVLRRRTAAQATP